MYHQLQAIGEEGVIAEIDYTVEDDAALLITKIVIDGHPVPVGAFDLRQVEDMTARLLAGHEAVEQDLLGEYKISRWIDDYA